MKFPHKPPKTHRARIYRIATISLLDLDWIYWICDCFYSGFVGFVNLECRIGSQSFFFEQHKI
jgi:hypothetical protein